MKVIRLHEGKERALLRRHPWVFAGAIARGGGDLGETVRVDAADGRVLGWAAFSPNSQIRLRMWSFDAEQRIDRDFFRERLQAAITRRARLGLDMQALRLVHGESDGMPGCIIDRYGDIVVLQALAAGIERIKPMLAELLHELLPQVRIYERSDAGVRALEGLQPVSGWLQGEGETRDDQLEQQGRQRRQQPQHTIRPARHAPGQEQGKADAGVVEQLEAAGPFHQGQMARRILQHHGLVNHGEFQVGGRVVHRDARVLRQQHHDEGHAGKRQAGVNRQGA